MTENKELLDYYSILCNNDYPKFINKYLNTKELQRLKHIGQFCGCDYTNLYNIKFWYSRFDHSIATALITWNFTKDKKQTLAALFHDLGTPVFSHCIDFLLNDSVNQESSEKDVKEILENSKEIKQLLLEDNILINEVNDVSMYPIVENESPRLCVDRLEGVLHTAYIWLNIWPIEKIKEVYENIVILYNEDNLQELGFRNVISGELFFEAVYEYSMALQDNINKFTMKYISEKTKQLIKSGAIEINDLYTKKEEEIVGLINNHFPSWNTFKKANTLVKSNTKSNENYNVSIESKKRYVIPLCKFNEDTFRLDKASNKVKKLLEKYKNYRDKKYGYIEGLKS